MPEREVESVFLSEWLDLPKFDSDIDWDQLNQINAIALKALEVARDNGEIGSSLDAHLIISVDQETHDLLNQFSEELRFLFITSSVDLQLDDALDSNQDISVTVKKSDAEKCGRCWHRQESVGDSDEHPEICARCILSLIHISEPTRPY